MRSYHHVFFPNKGVTTHSITRWLIIRWVKEFTYHPALWQEINVTKSNYILRPSIFFSKNIWHSYMPWCYIIHGKNSNLEFKILLIIMYKKVNLFVFKIIILIIVDHGQPLVKENAVWIIVQNCPSNIYRMKYSIDEKE